MNKKMNRDRILRKRFEDMSDLFSYVVDDLLYWCDYIMTGEECACYYNLIQLSFSEALEHVRDSDAASEFYDKLSEKEKRELEEAWTEFINELEKYAEKTCGEEEKIIV